jgi:non-ribosomal peptide synthase protein (TIGR01720 family)
LSREETSRLRREVPRAYRTHVDDVLLTALGRATVAVTGERELVLALESHGRETELVHDADLSGTVGWFTAIAPIRLTVPDADLGDALTAVKEQLRAIPMRGIGYGLLRYLNPRTADELATLPWPTVSFNNLGVFDTTVDAAGDPFVLRPSPETDPPAHHPDNRRPHLLDITAIVEDDALLMVFSHSPSHHPAGTVQALAHRTIDELRALIEHCTGRTRTVFTPSDFPESGLDATQLTQLLADVE